MMVLGYIWFRGAFRLRFCEICALLQRKSHFSEPSATQNSRVLYEYRLFLRIARPEKSVSINSSTYKLRFAFYRESPIWKSEYIVLFSETSVDQVSFWVQYLICLLLITFLKIGFNPDIISLKNEVNKVASFQI